LVGFAPFAHCGWNPMTSGDVQTVGTAADRFKIVLAVALILAGFVAYYLLGAREDWMRWSALLASLVVAVVVFASSFSGQAFIAYVRESVRETKKVVWPTRTESLQMTFYVFGFVFLMALFLWLTDKTLEWVLYDLVLGWK